MRGKSSGRAFPVHKQGPFFPIDHMLFYFGDVVRHIIDHMHIQVIRGGVEDFGKSLDEGRDRRESPVEKNHMKASSQYSNTTDDIRNPPRAALCEHAPTHPHSYIQLCSCP